jgi:hypothetical protein
MGTPRPHPNPRPRRATAADAAALAALAPQIAAADIAADSDRRAVFVIDGHYGPGQYGPVAAIDLALQPGHISIEHLVGDRRASRALLVHAARAARALGVAELRWPGFAGGTRRVRNGPLQRLDDRLDDLGVPLWRDGTASLSQSVYFRGTWAAVALLLGLGSISIAVFSGTDVTLAHIVVPALLSAAAAAFAIYQIGLLAVAARRTGGRGAFTATAAIAALTIVAIGGLVGDRAVPAVQEMWAIYTGDTALNDLDVSLSPDGTTLYVSGSYGFGGEDTVARALEQHPGIRTVVLSGPGGRASVGFDLYRMFRQRKLATRVDGDCVSACTFAFLGGVDRSISPGGRLGFHRASFPGMGDQDMYESNRDLRRFLIDGGGVTPQFADRVFATPPDSIWVPTPQELLAGRVINRINR